MQDKTLIQDQFDNSMAEISYYEKIGGKVQKKKKKKKKSGKSKIHEGLPPTYG